MLILVMSLFGSLVFFLKAECTVAAAASIADYRSSMTKRKYETIL